MTKSKRTRAEKLASLKLRAEALNIGLQVGREAAGRSLGPDAERGQKVVQAARLGHAATYGTAEEKRVRWAAMQQLLDSLTSGSGALPAMVARKRVAGEFNCCVRTVQRHTSLNYS